MSNVVILHGSFHRFEEPRPATPTYTSEPLPILPDGSFDLSGTIHEQPMIELDESLAALPCAICDAFGQTCCKLHRDLARGRYLPEGGGE